MLVVLSISWALMGLAVLCLDLTGLNFLKANLIRAKLELTYQGKANLKKIEAFLCCLN